MSQLEFRPSTTLDRAAWGPAVKRILAAALEAVEPGAALRQHVQRRRDRLLIGEQNLDLRTFNRVRLVSIGKAAAPMAVALADILKERLDGGIVITKEGHLGPTGSLPGCLEALEAGHPTPDGRGMDAARKLAVLLAGGRSDDLVLALISGGGSALLVSPADGLALADLQALTAQLLACGADIDAINTLRKHLETLKGGGLARLCAPARLVTLALSDVIGDPPDVIASGPTVPDRSTFADAWQALQRCGLTAKAPPAVLRRLMAGLAGELPETPKPGDPAFAASAYHIIGSNRQAAQAALEQAQREGFRALLLTATLQGEARLAGEVLAALLQQAAASPRGRPICMIAGGETTVTLHGDGLGGRNQEAALGAVRTLAGVPNVALLALATDGGDGPTDAAGAIVTGETLGRAIQAGMAPEDYLYRNDAYHFFEKLGDLLITGPTRTNVNDLSFLFAF